MAKRSIRKRRHRRTGPVPSFRDRVAFRLAFSVKPAAMSVKLQLLREPQTAFFRAFKAQNLLIARNKNEQMQEEVRAKLNPKDKNKAPRGAEKQRLDLQLDELERWMWYIDFYDEVHDKARIHFRNSWLLPPRTIQRSARRLSRPLVVWDPNGKSKPSRECWFGPAAQPWGQPSNLSWPVWKTNPAPEEICWMPVVAPAEKAWSFFSRLFRSWAVHPPWNWFPLNWPAW